jgi:hypothetical protein
MYRYGIYCRTHYCVLSRPVISLSRSTSRTAQDVALPKKCKFNITSSSFRLPNRPTRDYSTEGREGVHREHKRISLSLFPSVSITSLPPNYLTISLFPLFLFFPLFVSSLVIFLAPLCPFSSHCSPALCCAHYSTGWYSTLQYSKPLLQTPPGNTPLPSDLHPHCKAIS